MAKLVASILTLILCFTLLSACKGSVADTNSNSSDISSDSTSSGAAIFTKGEKGYIAPAAKNFTSFENGEKTVVICWGDSLTSGMGMDKPYNYPSQLQSNLNGQFKVVNAGVGGETSATITSRANAIGTFLAKDIILEKGQSSIEFDGEFLYAANGHGIEFKGFSKELPFNKLIIGDQTFDVLFHRGGVWEDVTYTLVRENTDLPLIIKKGASVSYDYSSLYEKNYCNVILMGGNDGTNVSLDMLIENYRKIGSTSDKNIYIIKYNADEQKTTAFKQAFGEQALETRDYFVNHALEDYGMIPTALDSLCVDRNMVPASFHLNNDRWNSHLSELGYKVLADLVYKKGVELGYWK